MDFFHLGSGADVTGGTSWTIPAINPNPARTTIFVLWMLPDNPPVPPTVSGARGTWTRYVTSPDPLAGSGDERMYIFVGTGSAANEAVTVDFGTGNDQLAIMYQFVDADSVGAGPIVQAVAAGNATGSSPALATLAAFGNGSNGALGFCVVGDTDSVLAAGSGFTSLADVNSWYDAGKLFCQKQNAADTTVDVTYTVTSANGWSIIGIEIAAPGGGGGNAARAAHQNRQRRAA